MTNGKQDYYEKYFETSWNNIQNTWRGIKYLISPKTVVSSVPDGRFIQPLFHGMCLFFHRYSKLEK